MDVSAGKSRNSFFFPWCRLCLSPSCLSPSVSVLLNKCNQQGGLRGMSVTKSNGSLQIPQARWTGSLKEDDWRTQGVLSPHPLSVSPFLCLLFLQTSNILTFSIFKECPLILMTMQQKEQYCSGETLILCTPEDPVLCNCWWVMRWRKRKVQS